MPIGISCNFDDGSLCGWIQGDPPDFEIRSGNDPNTVEGPATGPTGEVQGKFLQI